MGACHEWLGATNGRTVSKRGGPTLTHGKLKVDGRTELAHRVALALYKGLPVSDLGLVAHRCDNPLCVRVDHLEESTHGRNLKDAYERGRR